MLSLAKRTDIFNHQLGDDPSKLSQKLTMFEWFRKPQNFK